MAQAQGRNDTDPTRCQHEKRFGGFHGTWERCFNRANCTMTDRQTGQTKRTCKRCAKEMEKEWWERAPRWTRQEDEK